MEKLFTLQNLLFLLIFWSQLTDKTSYWLIGIPFGCEAADVVDDASRAEAMIMRYQNTLFDTEEEEIEQMHLILNPQISGPLNPTQIGKETAEGGSQKTNTYTMVNSINDQKEEKTRAESSSLKNQFPGKFESVQKQTLDDKKKRAEQDPLNQLKVLNFIIQVENDEIAVGIVKSSLVNGWPSLKYLQSLIISYFEHDAEILWGYPTLKDFLLSVNKGRGFERVLRVLDDENWKNIFPQLCSTLFAHLKKTSNLEDDEGTITGLEIKEFNKIYSADNFMAMMSPEDKNKQTIKLFNSLVSLMNIKISKVASMKHPGASNLWFLTYYVFEFLVNRKELKFSKQIRNGIRMNSIALKVEVYLKLFTVFSKARVLVELPRRLENKKQITVDIPNGLQNTDLIEFFRERWLVMEALENDITQLIPLISNLYKINKSSTAIEIFDDLYDWAYKTQVNLKILRMNEAGTLSTVDAKSPKISPNAIKEG